MWLVLVPAVSMRGSGLCDKRPEEPVSPCWHFVVGKGRSFCA